jgi:hypothetical protein
MISREREKFHDVDYGESVPTAKAVLQRELLKPPKASRRFGEIVKMRTNLAFKLSVSHRTDWQNEVKHESEDPHCILMIEPKGSPASFLRIYVPPGIDA